MGLALENIYRFLFGRLAKISALFILSYWNANANIVLPAVFNSHMVIQQNSEVTIWGWGKPLEVVSVTGSWDSKTYTVEVANDAAWKVKFRSPKGSFTPYSISIKGYNTIILEDILFGEVWLCSGQSNMEWTARAKIDNWDEEVKAAVFPQIRFFSVLHKTAQTPQLDLVGDWKVCSPETMIDFSSVAYFFGRELFKNLNIPIGLVNSSWGGTPAEVWCNEKTIINDSILNKASKILTEVPWGPIKPGVVYNTMINPLVPLKIAGAIWYQGEGNTINPLNYDLLLKSLIQNWRQDWGYEFPFYFVQIAPFEYSVSFQGALIRDAQRRVLKMPKTGMVVTSDIGNIKNIHPLNKQDVGKRLGQLALNQTYEKTELPISGPLYKSFTIEKNKIRLEFDFVYDNLVCNGKELVLFEIAGDDRKFYSAQAKIDKKTILVYSKMVSKPTAVRFAFTNTAEPNLFNSKGLPASCFRTDDWEVILK